MGSIAALTRTLAPDDLQIVSGTAYVSDVGLSGAFDGVIGMDAGSALKETFNGAKALV